MLQSFIESYGVIAVFIGAALEGETAVFLGGVLAHRHLVVFWQVALAAASGSFLADQLFFLAGRWGMRVSFVRRMAGSPAMSRVTALLEGHPISFILAFRFIYGMRTISPLAIGMSRVSTMLFVILNAASAIVWGTAIAAIGYLFGNAVEALFGRLHLHLHLFIGLGAAVCLAALAAVFSRRIADPVRRPAKSLNRDDRA